MAWLRGVGGDSWKPEPPDLATSPDQSYSQGALFSSDGGSWPRGAWASSLDTQNYPRPWSGDLNRLAASPCYLSEEGDGLCSEPENLGAVFVLSALCSACPVSHLWQGCPVVPN